jgi:hypothetical protein
MELCHLKFWKEKWTRGQQGRNNVATNAFNQIVV